MFSTVQTVFVAMSRYPEVQKKAQAELDSVVGSNRLPEFCDRPSLVYVNAVIKEALRWQVVLPFSLPHMTTEDDVFRGYFIPAGTVIMPNVRLVEFHDVPIGILYFVIHLALACTIPIYTRTRTSSGRSASL